MKKPNFFDNTPQGRWDKVEDKYKDGIYNRSYHFKPLGATKKKRRKKK